MNAALLLLLLLPPDSAADSYAKGVRLIELGRPDQAVGPLRAATEAAPRNAQYHKALGVSFALQKRYTEADDPFARACALQPALPDACYFYARNLYALDRYQASLEMLRKTLGSDSRPWRIWLAAAQAEQALGLSAGAEKSFRNAIRLHTGQSPASDDPRVHFGSFLFREGRIDEAAAVLRELCTLRPDSARGHLELGRVEMHLDSLEEAEQHFRRALELGFGEQAQLLLDRVATRRRAR